MNIIETRIPEVKILEPRVFGDDRGFFMETFRATDFAEYCSTRPLVQDNHSKSCRGVLRGLHYQLHQPQGKLVRVISGEVYDVAVDMRRNSATFGHWVGVFLSAENKRQLWVPEGFAHGFYVTSDEAEFVYKCTDYYSPQDERCLRWDDPTLAIEWPLQPGGAVETSAKDEAGVLFQDAEYYL